jgi:UDP-2,3-diacylglucosamine pyrophosphatase LpxH
MRDPAYEGEVPMESQEDWEATIAGHVHKPEVVTYWGDPNTYWQCAICGEPLYELFR